MKKVVVTGGAGFIGSNLVRTLVGRGDEVRVVDDFTGGKFADRLVDAATYYEVNVCDLDALKTIFAGAETVFHLAAKPRVQESIDFPLETERVNVEGTLIVLEAARATGVRRVIFSSSAAVYGDAEAMPLKEDIPARPKSPYGLHKQMGEQLCRLWSELYKLPTVSLRYFNVYGPGFDPGGSYALVVGRFLDLRRQGKPLTIAGDGGNTRDYIHVRDVVRANLLAAEAKTVGQGEVFNVGSGIETSINDLANLIGGETESAPARIEPTRCLADVSRARDQLGFTASIELAEGIAELKSNYGLSLL